MRFMVFMIPGDSQAETGKMSDEKTITSMMKYNEELAEAGVLLGVDGLQPSAKGAHIRFSGGNAVVTEGPSSEAREIVVGYWMWQVKSKEEAIAWASRCPAADGDVLELRQISELGLRVRRRTPGGRIGRGDRRLR